MPLEHRTTVVLEALARSRGKGSRGQGYRTVKGLARETRLSEMEVRTVLSRHPEFFVRSSIRHASGAALFGLSASAPTAGQRPSPTETTETTTDAAPAPDPPPPAPRDVSAEPLKVFYSYSHRDERHRERLETYLAPLRREGLIAEWHDRRIDAGTDWRDDIDRELNRADLILLLVSGNFMASAFVSMQELTVAMERHRAGTTRVIPIIVTHADWRGSFGHLQALPRDGKPITTWRNRDEAWYNVAQGLRATIEDLQADR